MILTHNIKKLSKNVNIQIKCEEGERKKIKLTINEMGRKKRRRMINMYNKRPTALSIPRRSPIQVLTQPYVA